MTVVNDIADDLLMTDGLVAVTVTLYRVAGNATVSVPHALREAISKNVQNYGGMSLQGGESVWHILDSELNPSANGRVINAGDEIAYGSQTYIVITAQQDGFGHVWRCLVNVKL